MLLLFKFVCYLFVILGCFAPVCFLSPTQLANNGCTDEGLQPLCKHLNKNVHLTSLSLARNAMTSLSVDALVAALKGPVSVLTTLDVAGCGLGATLAMRLCAAVAANRRLLHFDISANKLNANGSTALEALFPVGAARMMVERKEEHLEKALSEPGVSPALATTATAASAAGPVDITQSNLRVLRVGDNALGDGAWRFLSRALRTSLVRLDLSRNRMSEANIVAVSEHLQSPFASLTDCDVSGNKMSAASARTFLQAVSQSHTLRHLNLANCGLDGGSLNVLCDVLLATPCRLTTVSAHGNALFGDPWFEKLAAVVARNTSLNFLNVAGCNTLQEDGHTVLSALRSNVTLHTMRVSLPGWDAGLARCLCQVAKINISLRQLDIMIAHDHAIWARNHVFALHRDNMSDDDADVDDVDAGADGDANAVAAVAETERVWWRGLDQPLLNADLVIAVNQMCLTPSRAARLRAAAAFLPSSMYSVLFAKDTHTYSHTQFLSVFLSFFLCLVSVCLSLSHTH
jgi:Ran GTPase-activating protein (RanGAP) involved in mRNA processing and transport